ncbi:uncharacterized protein [Phaseolus vulgaris]|uniref:uncharacterized protein n=1 Tax=Phaseolus vulgaris TaxID=3885 RepID=UPI0035CC5B82
MSLLRQNTNSIKDVNPTNENWILIVRVIRMWFVSNFKKTKFSLSMEMGHTIHFGTKVTSLSNDLVSTATPQYNPMFVLRAPDFDTDYLVVTGVGIERELNRTCSSTKLNVISIKVDGMIETTNSPIQGLSQLFDSGKQNVEDEFIHLIPRNTIQGQKDCKEYKLKVRVIDDTNSTTFILFDKDATKDLFNKFSNEAAELQSQTDDSRSDILLSVEVVASVLKRYFASPSHTPDDDIPLRNGI